MCKLCENHMQLLSRFIVAHNYVNKMYIYMHAHKIRGYVCIKVKLKESCMAYELPDY